MGEHKDDESELDASIPIASLSFGQTRDFVLKCPHKPSLDIKPHRKSHVIPLGHGDLLLMNNPTNKYWTHCVPRRKNVPGVRISLTFRKINKVDSRKRKLFPDEATSPYFKKSQIDNSIF